MAGIEKIEVLLIEDRLRDVDQMKDYIRFDNKLTGRVNLTVLMINEWDKKVDSETLRKVRDFEPRGTVITDGLEGKFPSIVEAARANVPQRRVCLVTGTRWDYVCDQVKKIKIEYFNKEDLFDPEIREELFLGKIESE